MHRNNQGKASAPELLAEHVIFKLRTTKDASKGSVPLFPSVIFLTTGKAERGKNNNANHKPSYIYWKMHCFSENDIILHLEV